VKWPFYCEFTLCQEIKVWPRRNIGFVERLKFSKEKIKVFSKGKSLDRKK
jgi:hypothetical protein